MHIYKYAQIENVTHNQNVSVTPVTIIRMSYNKNTANKK